MSTITEIQSSRAEKNVSCLNCSKPIDYREGTCPHCGYVEFREPERDETSIELEAQQIAHGLTLKLARKEHLVALQRSYVKTFQRINEILESDSSPYAKLALIKNLTKAAGKPEAA